MNTQALQLSKSYLRVSPRQVHAISNFKDAARYPELMSFGLHFAEDALDGAVMALKNPKVRAAMDAIQPLITTASVTTPVQFLQTFLPGWVAMMTAPLQIEELIGMEIVGRFEDEQIVQGKVELTGEAVPYGDSTNIPFASWNSNFEYRTVVRFEQGFQVPLLQELRAAAMRLDSASSSRNAASKALNISLNRVGFYGFNGGANFTYGFLNDPSLLAYTTVAVGAGATTEWSTKTFLEITADLRTAVATLRSQSKDNINPKKTPMTLAIATSSVDYLSTTSDFGISVEDWIKQNYPTMRVMSDPNLDAANAGDNVFYLFAEEVEDEASTDDKRVWALNVQSKFYMLGVAREVKRYIEDYANATAGVMVKRPFAVTRWSGI